MALNRRSLLKLTGAAAVILGAGGASFVLTRSPDKALAPWAEAGASFSDPRLTALSYAILAPNPHNRQPWLLDLRTEGEITLFCDPERLLPVTDPESRQIVIGLGCFLELLRLAAAETGHRAAIDPFPDGEPGRHLGDRPIARISFRPDSDVAKDPLFAQVLNRRSNKEPYDTARPVAAAMITELAAAAGPGVTVAGSTAPDRLAALRDLTWRGMEIELTTEDAYMESVHLMRIGKTEIEANPDGIDLGGPFLESLAALGMLTRETIADTKSTAFQQGLDMFRSLCASAMGHVWVTTKDNGRTTQLDVGRAWVRLNLAATGLGLGLHPMSQTLQEYPEMRELYDEVHGLLTGGSGERVQMLGRLGYGPDLGPSPRWPVAARLIKV